MAKRQYKKPKHEQPNGKGLPKTTKVWAKFPPETFNMYSVIHKDQYAVLNSYKDFDKRIVLNRHIGISMMNIPNGTVLENSMPEQRNEMLGKEFNLRYRTSKYVGNSNRPSFHNAQQLFKYYDHIYTFKVIRWDNTDNIVILINNEKQIVLITEPKYVLPDGSEFTGEYYKVAYNGYIHYTPSQNFSFLGKNVMCTYSDSNGICHLGTIIRADITEDNPQCIILEDRGDSYRILTIDEGFFFMQHGDIELNSATTEKSIYENFWPKDWRNLAYD